MTNTQNMNLELLEGTDIFNTDSIKSNFEKIDQQSLIPTKIVDNCVTDNSNLPLSAKQGKELQEQITELNGNIMTTKVITVTPNPDWVKGGDILCFKIANRYIFQFTEIEFVQEGHAGFVDTVLWTLGENTYSGRVFVLRPITDKMDDYFHVVRLYCYNDKIYGHYSNIYKSLGYFGLLIL